MKYKISYLQKFNEEGTSYNQTIKINLSREEFRGLNRFLAVKQLNMPSYAYEKLYLDTLKRGINYPTLTTTKYFITYFHNILDDKRFKTDRNTIIIINII